MLYADSAQARKVLGWQPSRDLHEILRSAWKWELKLKAAGYQL